MDPRIIAASEKGSRLSIPLLVFAVLGPPILWALHFNLIYFLMTLDCITRWDGGRWAVALATIVFLAGTIGAGWLARAMWRRLGRRGFAADERGWAAFLLVIGMAAAAIFSVAIALAGTAPFFVGGGGACGAASWLGFASQGGSVAPRKVARLRLARWLG